MYNVFYFTNKCKGTKKLFVKQSYFSASIGSGHPHRERCVIAETISKRIRVSDCPH